MDVKLVGELVRIVWEHVGLVVEDVMLVWDNILYWLVIMSRGFGRALDWLYGMRDM